MGFPYNYVIILNKYVPQDINSTITDIVIPGEINGKQLKSMNVLFSLIGHSERRIYNKEDNMYIIEDIKNTIDSQKRIDLPFPR